MTNFNPGSISPEVSEAQDIALQAITAMIGGERALAGRLLADAPIKEVVLVCLADLVAYVNRRLVTVIVGEGATQEQHEASWAAMAADIAEWRYAE